VHYDKTKIEQTRIQAESVQLPRYLRVAAPLQNVVVPFKFEQKLARRLLIRQGPTCQFL
jgi:hypothetical protein